LLHFCIKASTDRPLLEKGLKCDGTFATIGPTHVDSAKAATVSLLHLVLNHISSVQ